MMIKSVLEQSSESSETQVRVLLPEEKSTLSNWYLDLSVSAGKNWMC